MIILRMTATRATLPGQMSYLLEGIDWRNSQQTWRPTSAGWAVRRSDNSGKSPLKYWANQAFCDSLRAWKIAQICFPAMLLPCGQNLSLHAPRAHRSRLNLPWPRRRRISGWASCPRSNHEGKCQIGTHENRSKSADITVRDSLKSLSRTY